MFKRRIGDFHSSAKARCGGTLCISIPQNQNFTNDKTNCKKTAKKFLAQKPKTFFIKHYTQKRWIKSKRSSMGIFSRISHTTTLSYILKKKRLNGLGVLDETTLVPLNTVDVEPMDQNKKPNQRSYCFHCGRYGHYKTHYRKFKKDRYYETKVRKGEPNSTDPLKPKCDMCGKMH